MIKDLFGLTIASSTVSNIEKRAHMALEKAYLTIKSYLKRKSYEGVDETSWRGQGLHHYIWVASTDDAVCFSISRHRNRLAFHNFLGEAPYGMSTDRYSVYHSHKGPHQYCLAHILRDFQRIADRNGDEGEIGPELIFHLRKIFGLSLAQKEFWNTKYFRSRVC